MAAPPPGADVQLPPLKSDTTRATGCEPWQDFPPCADHAALAADQQVTPADGYEGPVLSTLSSLCLRLSPQSEEARGKDAYRGTAPGAAAAAPGRCRRCRARPPARRR